MSEETLSESCFHNYRKMIHDLTGITIDINRKSMLVGRIRKRVAELALSNYEDYLKYIKENKDEEKCFVTLITTNETYFYRTPRVWDFIEKSYLPNLQKKDIKVWSAACSTGDEAHTLGIICQQHKDKVQSFNYKVTGTDISASVLKKASEGLYVGRAVERFRETRAELFQKYMIGDDTNGYKVLPSIKNNIKFESHNLFRAFEHNEKFDLILLRNVLIYFNKEDQEKVLSNMYKCLAPDGFLIIGESESLYRLETDFESVSPLIYRPRMGLGKVA
jgi:chemotaxis protein methyltransferase CheR